ncbi:40880_t:CDS:2 [Gigaspora margarita]|uniref:40880_t:CDS:1 n=1 Tax=Gigaspora margarita TaxID=4874 RepID=A0ABN7U4V6_GIGMA|nr:40880_t:CDS:2 [Gigaspora margarita]
MVSSLMPLLVQTASDLPENPEIKNPDKSKSRIVKIPIIKNPKGQDLD